MFARMPDAIPNYLVLTLLAYQLVDRTMELYTYAGVISHEENILYPQTPHTRILFFFLWC